MKYSLGEVRKTGAAAAGVVVTIGGYLIAEGSPVKDLLPPEWVALIGGIVTILGVFFAPNDRSTAEKQAAEQAVVAVKKVKEQVNDPALAVAEVTVDTALDAVTRVQDIVNRLRPKTAA